MVSVKTGLWWAICSYLCVCLFPLIGSLEACTWERRFSVELSFLNVPVLLPHCRKMEKNIRGHSALLCDMKNKVFLYPCSNIVKEEQTSLKEQRKLYYLHEYYFYDIMVCLPFTVQNTLSLIISYDPQAALCGEIGPIFLMQQLRPINIK